MTETSKNDAGAIPGKAGGRGQLPPVARRLDAAGPLSEFTFSDQRTANTNQNPASTPCLTVPPFAAAPAANRIADLLGEGGGERLFSWP